MRPGVWCALGIMRPTVRIPVEQISTLYTSLYLRIYNRQDIVKDGSQRMWFLSFDFPKKKRLWPCCSFGTSYLQQSLTLIAALPGLCCASARDHFSTRKWSESCQWRSWCFHHECRDDAYPTGTLTTSRSVSIYRIGAQHEKRLVSRFSLGTWVTTSFWVDDTLTSCNKQCDEDVWKHSSTRRWRQGRVHRPGWTDTNCWHHSHQLLHWRPFANPLNFFSVGIKTVTRQVSPRLKKQQST